MENIIAIKDAVQPPKNNLAITLSSEGTLPILPLLPEELSYLDVKDMYDRAYTALLTAPDEHKTQDVMAEAIRLGILYRCQLARKDTYRKKSGLHEFHIVSE